MMKTVGGANTISRCIAMKRGCKVNDATNKVQRHKVPCVFHESVAFVKIYEREKKERIGGANSILRSITMMRGCMVNDTIKKIQSLSVKLCGMKVWHFAEFSKRMRRRRRKQGLEGQTLSQDS